MYQASTIMGGWRFHHSRLIHPDQPRPDWSDSVGNEIDALTNTIAVFRHPTYAEPLAEALNALDPKTSAEYARLEDLALSLPAIEAVALPRKAEVELRVSNDVVGLAIRADGRPATSEAALLTGLLDRVRSVLVEYRARFVAEIPVAGSPKGAVVDSDDAEAVRAAGPWSWSSDAVVNEAGVTLGDFVMEPAWPLQAVSYRRTSLDCRRARLALMDTVTTVALRVDPTTATLLAAMSPAEIATMVAGVAA